MNGVHDMGGMQGLGAISPEAGEPVFHHAWEGRVLAMNLAMRVWGRWNTDAFRHQLECIPAAEYLRMSYYEKWLTGLIELTINAGLITRDEVESGRPAEGGKPAPAPQPRVREPSSEPQTPRFASGQSVRARTINPAGHTRLPRYVRGRAGTIERDHGVHVFPDTNAHFLGENPQRLYGVHFAARELWGEAASPRDSVSLDLWDSYLEPA